MLNDGEITPENQEYGNGKIILSPEGAKMSLEEIEEALKIDHNQQKGRSIIPSFYYELVQKLTGKVSEPAQLIGNSYHF